MFKSKFDKSIKLDNKIWAITIARHGEHAVLLIEKCIDDGYELWRCDFIKFGSNKNYNYSGNRYSYFDKGTYNGEVRRSELIGAQDMTKKEILSKFKLSQKKSNMATWMVSKKKVVKMEKKIAKEVEQQLQGKYIKFNISGKKGTCNCITWAEKKLQELKIKLRRSFITKVFDKLTLPITSQHISDYSKHK